MVIEFFIFGIIVFLTIFIGISFWVISEDFDKNKKELLWLILFIMFDIFLFTLL